MTIYSNHFKLGNGVMRTQKRRSILLLCVFFFTSVGKRKTKNNKQAKKIMQLKEQIKGKNKQIKSLRI